MQHLKKSNSPRCKCRFCGKSDGECSLTSEIARALKRFASGYGIRWKKLLSYRWGSTQFELSTELQQARNIIGPTRLQGITIHMLDAVIERESKVPA